MEFPARAPIKTHCFGVLFRLRLAETAITTTTSITIITTGISHAFLFFDFATIHTLTPLIGSVGHPNELSQRNLNQKKTG